MAQKTVLITGATSGIGLAGAEALAKKGWRVLVHARHAGRGGPVLTALRGSVPGGAFELVTGDLSSLHSVADLARQVAARAPVLDALWNNAGGWQTERRHTVDGIELQMAVNHLAGFALTSRLLPLLKAAPAGRVVATGSGAHAFSFDRIDDWFGEKPGRYRPWGVYTKSKLANVLFTQELSRRLEGSSVTAHCFHPGWVRTGFGLDGRPEKPGLVSAAAAAFALAPEQGADTGVFLVDDPEPLGVPGSYWVKRKPKNPARTTPEAAALLWLQSEAVVRRVWGEPPTHP
jgi:NAD(P)-dependent dehydrogenase (short-subunit alcohol dehydrogenase family)